MKTSWRCLHAAGAPALQKPHVAAVAPGVVLPQPCDSYRDAGTRGNRCSQHPGHAKALAAAWAQLEAVAGRASAAKFGWQHKPLSGPASESRSQCECRCWLVLLSNHGCSAELLAGQTRYCLMLACSDQRSITCSAGSVNSIPLASIWSSLAVWHYLLCHADLCQPILVCL